MTTHIIVSQNLTRCKLYINGNILIVHTRQLTLIHLNDLDELVLCLSFRVTELNIVINIIWFPHISIDTECMFTLYGLHILEFAPNIETAPTDLWGVQNKMTQFCGHHHVLVVDVCDVSVSNLKNDIFTTSFIVIYHLCYLSAKDRSWPITACDRFAECEFHRYTTCPGIFTSNIYVFSDDVSFVGSVSYCVVSVVAWILYFW